MKPLQLARVARSCLAALSLLAVVAGARSARAAPPRPAGEAGEDSEAGETDESETEAPDQLVEPQLLAPVTFDYPEALLERDDPPSGTITVEYVVGTDGIPIEIVVLDSPDPALDALGIEVVSKLRYEPGRYAGEAVEVKLSLSFEVVPPTPEPNAPEPDTPDPDAPEPDTPDPGAAPGATTDPTQAGEISADDANAGPVRILGRVREAGYRTPIEGASVLAVPAGDLPVGEIRGTRYEQASEPAWTVQVLSDAEGNYALRGVPEGKVRLIVLAPGYLRSDRVVELAPGKQLEINVWPRRESSNPYRTEVVVEREAMPEVVERSLSVEEIQKLPGSQGDALRAVLNFPGVARSPFGGGLLAIRGAAPEDSAVYLGYHEIPLLFHFGGLRSVFASEILAEIDFIPGNFDSRYGDAIGGVVNVQPRKGRRDGYHGFIDVNAFDSGFLVEGPVGRGSFAVAGRRSYIDFILPRVLPQDSGINFTVAPRYWDYQLLFDYPIDDGEFTVRAFGSSDQTRLLFSGANDDPDEAAEARNQVETSQYFARLDLVYRKRIGPWEFLVTPAYRRGTNDIGILGFLDLDVTTDDFTARAEVSRQLGKRLRWRVGTELTGTIFDISVTAPAPTGGNQGIDTSTSLSRDLRSTLFRGALYSTLTVGLGERVLLYPGLRVEWYADPLDRAAVDPRLRGVWQVTESTAIKGAVGLYSQGIQQPVQFDSVFGNPRLGLQRSVHASLGVAQDLPWDSFIEVTGFYKELWDLVSPSTEIVARPGGLLGPENFANTGTGRIYGMELLLRKDLTKNLFGWVSYTLSRSTRRDAPGLPSRLFDFDQTHILTLIASYKFARGWQLGARFRLVSGNPFTPITDGVVDAQLGGFIPVNGPINGDRLPVFHQLDLRLDKTWTLPVLQVGVYVDVQNVYNRQNVEFVNYAFDFRSFSTINSLPIIPAVGFRVDL